jgi:hypothetical protein
MTKHLAFRATYADWKLIKTRGVIQVVMEVPLADADAAYKVLGGMPDSSRETWFAVAPLAVPQPAKEAEAKPRPEDAPSPPVGVKRQKWDDITASVQAGIRCNDPVFDAFLMRRYPDLRDHNDAAECVRLYCNVLSRSQLNRDLKAKTLWEQLEVEFQAWKLVAA